MPKYDVSLPIVGVAWIEVEADNPTEAVEAALNADWDDFEITEEFVERHVTQGNVCYAPLNSVDVQEIKDV